VIPGGWRCPKRIGFLFPHPCERLTPAGCPDCDNGRVEDPYRSRSDRQGYPDDDFDNYTSDETGGASGPPVFGGGDSGGGGASVDFTEADGASLVNADDAFEDDLSAS
jgi:hypothetical protein